MKTQQQKQAAKILPEEYMAPTFYQNGRIETICGKKVNGPVYCFVVSPLTEKTLFFTESIDGTPEKQIDMPKERRVDFLTDVLIEAALFKSNPILIQKIKNVQTFLNKTIEKEKAKQIDVAQKAQENKRIREENEQKTAQRKTNKKMMGAFSKKNDFDFIYDRDANDHLCLYGKVNKEIIYLNLNTEKPCAYALAPTSARPLLDAPEFSEIYGKIIENLGHDAQFETNLNNMGEFYRLFKKKYPTYEKIHSKQASGLYQNISEKLMTPRVVRLHNERTTKKLESQARQRS